MTSFCPAVGLEVGVAVWEKKGSQKRSQTVAVPAASPAPLCEKESDELSGRANAFHQVEASLIPDLMLGLASPVSWAQDGAYLLFTKDITRNGMMPGRGLNSNMIHMFKSGSSSYHLCDFSDIT